MGSIFTWKRVCDAFVICFLPSSTDASEALALPGVIDVVTVQDVPGDNGSEEERLYAQDKVVMVLTLIAY